MLITLPPWGPKCFTASWMVRIGPRTLVLNSRWNSFSVTASSGSNWKTPALFTSTSSDPNAFLVSSHVRRPGHVALDHDRPAALIDDLRDHAVRPGPAGGIVDHDRCPGLRQALRDSRADPLRRTRHDRYLS